MLDIELDAIADANTNVEIDRLPLTHLASAWVGLDVVTERIIEFFALSSV